MDSATLVIMGLSVLVVLLSLTVHEFSHAVAAYLQGDDTAERAGRLTLNPLAHLDPVGTILPILLMLAHSPIALGWAKPVPFNPLALRNQRWGSVIVGFAGPAANLLLCIICAVALNILLPILSSDNWLILFLVIGVFANMGLAIFNLLPIPPLDGSKLLQAVLPYQYQWIYHWLESYGTFLLLAFMLFGYEFISQMVRGGLCAILNLVGGVVGSVFGCGV